MAGFDPYANRPILSNWKMRTTSYLSPYYEEANEYLNQSVDRYIKKYSKINSHL